MTLGVWLRAIAAWLAVSGPLLAAMAWMLTQHTHSDVPTVRELQEIRIELRELRADVVALRQALGRPR